ncbi:hypothetical protein [Altererythrobacter aquiaggeris]|uniref:hypothetical protein n=1 Tax=Aestuarierythrobacter aquiaggeris TaxID=1898396 RepID=UPI003017DE40
MMAGLAIIVRARFSVFNTCLFGFLIGAAGLVTMKSLLLAPAFAGIAWLRWSDEGFTSKSALRLIAMAFSAVICLVLLYWAHAAGIGNSTGAISQARTTSGSEAVLISASQKMFFVGVPKYTHFMIGAALGAIPLILLVCLAILKKVRTPGSPAEIIAITGLILPLSCLAFYHNTLPYFYPFILAPVAAAAVIGAEIFTKRYNALFLAGLMVTNGAFFWLTDTAGQLQAQREIVAAADEIFPRPVAYFDFPNMLPHFDKANGFTTSWGREGYRNGIGKSYRAMMEQQSVPLLLTNDALPTRHFIELMSMNPQSAEFRTEDRLALRDNYLHFWGPYWLAGKIVPEGVTNMRFEFLVPGSYTVRAAPLVIDGSRYEPGQIVEISRGIHSLSNMGPLEARLVWGRDLQHPAEAAPRRPYWSGF